MKIRIERDVAAPVGPVWAGLTDFDTFEAQLRAGGAALDRVGGWTEPASGVGWQGSASLNGKTREIDGRIAAFGPKEYCVLECRVGGMVCTCEMTLLPAAAATTHVVLALELRASTLSAKVYLQTIRAGRAQVVRRLEGVLARHAATIENAWKASATS